MYSKQRLQITCTCSMFNLATFWCITHVAGASTCPVHITAPTKKLNKCYIVLDEV